MKLGKLQASLVVGKFMLTCLRFIATVVELNKETTMAVAVVAIAVVEEVAMVVVAKVVMATTCLRDHTVVDTEVEVVTEWDKVHTETSTRRAFLLDPAHLMVLLIPTFALILSLLCLLKDMDTRHLVCRATLLWDTTPILGCLVLDMVVMALPMAPCRCPRADLSLLRPVMVLLLLATALSLVTVLHRATTEDRLAQMMAPRLMIAAL